MPDEQLFLRVVVACVLISAVVSVASATGALLLFGRKWAAAHEALASGGSILGAGAAAYLGCAMLDLLPRWRLGEVEARFLYLLFPGTLIIEAVAALPRLPHWMAWALRVVLAAAAAPVLLHGSVYLADPLGAATSEWTESETYLVLGGLAAALLAVWALLAFLMRWTGDRFVPLALSGACAGAAVTIMLSGYLIGGELGLALAAALAGVALAALVLPGRGQEAGVLGIGVIGLFSLVILGRFFGKLTTLNAALLFAAPLLCWLPELPGVRRLWPWARGVLRIVIVLIPVVVVVILAHRQFVEDSKSSSHPDEPTTEDYLNFKP